MTNRTLLSSAEIERLKTELPAWTIQDGQKLQRQYKFATFAAAMGWLMSAAIEADKLDHHPNWSNVYNRVTVELWTHSSGGLTSLDWQLARKMDELATGNKKASH